MIITPIRMPKSDSVEAAASASNSSNSNGVSDDIMGEAAMSDIIAIYQIFEKHLRDYKIKMFIEKVDPTVQMYDTWLDNFDDFIKYTKSNILEPYEPILPDKPTIVYCKIQEFVQTFNKYTDYLGIRMRPIVGTDLFVPIYRDEDMVWYQDFIAEVKNYREKLISIYNEICSNVGHETTHDDNIAEP